MRSQCFPFAIMSVAMRLSSSCLHRYASLNDDNDFALNSDSADSTFVFVWLKMKFFSKVL